MKQHAIPYNSSFLSGSHSIQNWSQAQLPFDFLFNFRTRTHEITWFETARGCVISQISLDSALDSPSLDLHVLIRYHYCNGHVIN